MNLRNYLSSATLFYTDITREQIDELAVTHWFTILDDIIYVGTNEPIEGFTELFPEPLPVDEPVTEAIVDPVVEPAVTVK
jgi:hypothetical protein